MIITPSNCVMTPLRAPQAASGLQDMLTVRLCMMKAVFWISQPRHMRTLRKPGRADAAARAAQAPQVLRGDGRGAQLHAPGVLRQRGALFRQQQQPGDRPRQARARVGARPRLAQRVLQQQRQVRLVPAAQPQRLGRVI